MLNKSNLHTYQTHGVEHVIANPFCGLLLEMGLGKTVTTGTAINDLMYDLLDVDKVLIIAPLRVAESTWTDEFAKWEHLAHFKVSKILGNPSERRRGMAAHADIYIINRENIVWLVAELGGKWPYDMVVIDELSSFKNPQAARFKALKQVRDKIKRVVGLTGTPAPNGLIDLWPQIWLLDKGVRLGKTITEYRNRYFKPGRSKGHVVYEYNIDKHTEDDALGEDINIKLIHEKISDICISMKAEDWLELPPRIDIVRDVRLPSDIMKQYLDFEKKMILEISDTENVTALSASALTNKLLQFCNGAVYVDDKHNYTEVHNEKINELDELIEAANGNPMLVAYSFQSDVARIMQHLKHLKPVKLDTTAKFYDWNAGKIPFALGHPASMGHGLNLQDGGHLATWFGLNWALELKQQFDARLFRQGQKKSVIFNTLVCPGTMDVDVLKSNASKSGTQEALMQAVKARIKKYRG